MLSATRASPTDALPAAPRPTPPDAPRDGPRLPYLPGVDGLRAVAVGSVLLYHAEFSWMVGGYLGVEVFFVISGYLITSLLLAENTRTGKVGLGTFYLRRARRLLPALLVTLVGVLVLAQLFARDQVASLRGDVVAAAGYVSNWYFIIAQKSYFESGSASFVKHLWSLAIEEQFYLIWPLVFTGLLALFGRRRVLFVVIALAAASAAWMAHLAANIDLSDPNALNRVYMGTDTRAAGLLIGAALAIGWSPWRLKTPAGKSAPFLLDGIGVVALALLGWALYGMRDSSPELYQYGFAKISLLTAVVIAVAAHPAAHLGKVLGCAPLRWIGLRSYGIYLYHFPIFLLVKPDPVTDPQPNLYAFFLVRLALTMVVVEVSFRFIEMPVRRGAVGRLVNQLRTATGDRKRQLQLRWLAGAVASAVLLSALGLSVLRAQPVVEQDYIAIATGGGLTEQDSAGAVGSDGLPVGGGDLASAESTLPPTDSVTTIPAGGDASAPADPNAPPNADPNAADATTTVPWPALPPPAPPTTTPHGPVRAIGDSVMLGARPTLLGALGGNSAVDAAVSRQVTYAIQVMQKWQQLDQIPDVLIIHLGTNGTFNDQQFDQLMDAAKNVRKVLFVTNKVPRRWQDTNNAVIGEGTRRFPNAVLVDWYSESVDHPEYFAPDGYHLKPEGAAAYANLIVSKLG